MAVRNPPNQLREVGLSIRQVKSLPTTIMQDLVQVIVKILEHQRQFPLPVHNIT
jgi:hypothetical protein